MVDHIIRSLYTLFPKLISILKHCATVTIQTGLITSIFAVVDLIVYLADVSCAPLIYHLK